MRHELILRCWYFESHASQGEERFLSSHWLSPLWLHPCLIYREMHGEQLWRWTPSCARRWVLSVLTEDHKGSRHFVIHRVLILRCYLAVLSLEISRGKHIIKNFPGVYIFSFRRTRSVSGFFFLVSSYCCHYWFREDMHWDSPKYVYKMLLMFVFQNQLSWFWIWYLGCVTCLSFCFSQPARQLCQ